MGINHIRSAPLRCRETPIVQTHEAVLPTSALKLCDGLGDLFLSLFLPSPPGIFIDSGRIYYLLVELPGDVAVNSRILVSCQLAPFPMWLQDRSHNVADILLRFKRQVGPGRRRIGRPTENKRLLSSGSGLA